MLAGDPASPYPSAKWDRSCGFTTLRAAVAARRTEDRRACSIVGATPVWLPFNYGDYPRGADEKTMLAALRDAVAGSALVLVPGYPLSHADHRWLARLCLSHGFPAGRIGLYAEQPYTWWASGEPSGIPEPIADLLTSPLKWVRAQRRTGDSPQESCCMPRLHLASAGSRPRPDPPHDRFGHQARWRGDRLAAGPGMIAARRSQGLDRALLEPVARRRVACLDGGSHLSRRRRRPRRARRRRTGRRVRPQGAPSRSPSKPPRRHRRRSS